jgi:protein ImuA
MGAKRMSQGGKAENMAHLRSAIAGIEAHCEPTQTRAPLKLSVARALDPALGGGLSDDALHEIAPAQAGDGAAALGFALALAARFAATSPRSSTALLVSEDFCARETGALYGPGLAAHGLGLGRLVFARAPDASALLWAMEEALKSGALAVVVGEMWGPRHYGLAASRRLLLAARAGRAPALLVHGGAFGRAGAISSAAETRFEITAAASRRLEPASGRLGLPGAPAFAARLLKARLRPSAQGPPTRGFDEARMIRLEWNGVERCFRDPTISLPLVRASVDGPGASVAQG